MGLYNPIGGPILVLTLAALPWGMTAGGTAPGHQQDGDGRADGVARATPKTPVATPPARPQACVDGRELGPRRVQIGAVEAATRVGQEIAIPVRVKGVCGLAGFAFGITLNSRIADLVRVEQTPFLSGQPPVDVEFIGLRPGARRQTIAGLRARGTGGVDGIGTLARLIFRGMAEGSTTIELARLKLYDVDLKEMPTQAVPMRLTVLPEKARAPGGYRARP
jgi:hypothetical protein